MTMILHQSLMGSFLSTSWRKSNLGIQQAGKELEFFIHLHGKLHEDNVFFCRDIDTLTMQIQEIMKGSFDTFMLKEIFEQPESVCTTMAGRIDKANLTVTLGGITAYVPEIKRCRRLLLLGCGTSYISAIATRQILEEHTELPVMIDLASDFLDRSTPIFRCVHNMIIS